VLNLDLAVSGFMHFEERKGAAPFI